VRWRHPRHGLLTPDQFVPAAEETEIIRPLTRCALGLAIEQQAHWRDQGHALRVNVKIAGRNVQDHQLPRAVSGLLERWGVPPASLSITVDENTTLSLEAPVLRSLAKMGWASLWTTTAPTPPRCSASAPCLHRAAAGRFAAGLGAPRGRGSGGSARHRRAGSCPPPHVIATGVDDEAARTSIQRLGCDAAQGSLWATRYRREP